MNGRKLEWRADLLLIALLLYTAASLLHFVHNALFVEEYPNLPASLSSGRVIAAWFGVAAVGVVGYVLMRVGYHVVGLAVIAFYGALGFDGLAHYSLAPIAAHAWTMNFTIWLEVAAAALLLIVVARRFVARLSAS